jgi:hypothetical protein
LLFSSVPQNAKRSMIGNKIEMLFIVQNLVYH